MVLFISGCSSSADVDDESGSTELEYEIENKPDKSGSSIISSTALIEQENEMYSPDKDSTYLYWLDSSLVILNGSTKCNIFALNVLYRSGFKTPEENALAGDLFDTAYYKEILPVIEINKYDKAKEGDLVIWRNHVIIFKNFLKINEEDYAIAYWAGTQQPDNGDNVKNNVCYGKYKLNGEYVIRRPVKK